MAQKPQEKDKNRLFVAEEIVMEGISIDPDLCIQCESCMRTCSTKVADVLCTFSPNRMDTTALNVSCIKCGHCMAVCPTKAYKVEGLSYDEMPDAEQGCIISSDTMKKYMQHRRSQRYYTEELISDELMHEVLEAAANTSSGYNQHKQTWGILKGKDRVRAFADDVVDIISKDPAYKDYVKTYRAGKNSLTRDSSHLLFLYLPNDALSPSTNGTIALAYLEAVLPSFGLAGCWAGLLTNLLGIPEVSAMCQPPEGSKVIAVFMLGYPDREKEKFLRIPQRKAGEIKVL